jgi:hypothetical protein
MKISIRIEYFEDIDSKKQSLISIAQQLDIDPNRIHNFKEAGDVNKLDEYQITFDIYPRTVIESSAPTISNIKDKLNQMITDKDDFEVKSYNGSSVFLYKISFEEVDRPIPGKITDKKIISKFVDESIDGQIKYLKYKQSGFSENPEMDPRYKFDKGGLSLDPIPTPFYTESPTPNPSLMPSQTQVPNEMATEPTSN